MCVHDHYKKNFNINYRLNNELIQLSFIILKGFHTNKLLHLKMQ